MKRTWRILALALILVALMAGMLSAPAMAVTTNVTVYTSASDGWVQGWDTGGNYAAAHVNAKGISNTGVYSEIGQITTFYGIYRSFLFFDTSFIPDGATINTATISIYGQSDSSDTDFNIQIQNGMPTYPSDPLSLSDYSLANYSGNGGTLSTSSFVVGAYNDISLNATGLGWISKTGVTKLGLFSSRDISSTIPTNNEFILFYTSEQGQAYAPKLTINYTISAPAITANSASNIGNTGARLNSTITDDGGDTANVSARFGYGTTTQTAGNFANYDNITAWQTGLSDGSSPYYDSANLTQGTTYYYRVQVQNADSTVTSTSEISFTTTNSITAPTNLQAYPSSNSTALAWTRGSGSTRTLVRFRTDTYPTTTSDGTQIYLDSNNSFTHSGLNSGQTYYYALWGESGGSYSSTNVTIAMTTLAAGAALGTLPAPNTPYGWTQDPDQTKLSKLEPFYGLFNGFADSWGMPRANFWLGAWLFICVLIGIGSFIMFKSFGGSLALVWIAMVVMTSIGIMPSWMFFFEIIAALGVWSVSRESLGL